jgi:hypothetical protein
LDNSPNKWCSIAAHSGGVGLGPEDLSLVVEFSTFCPCHVFHFLHSYTVIYLFPFRGCFYYLHLVVVIDFEEEPAASIFRRAEGGQQIAYER